MPFGACLRSVRVKRRFTQPFMAASLGIALRTYQFYEQGKRQPDFEMLVAIADLLEVPTDYLLGRDLDRVASFDGYR